LAAVFVLIATLAATATVFVIAAAPIVLIVAAAPTVRGASAHRCNLALTFRVHCGEAPAAASVSTSSVAPREATARVAILRLSASSASPVLAGGLAMMSRKLAVTTSVAMVSRARMACRLTMVMGCALMMERCVLVVMGGEAA
jgi:hypothetical protein